MLNQIPCVKITAIKIKKKFSAMSEKLEIGLSEKKIQGKKFKNFEFNKRCKNKIEDYNEKMRSVHR